MSEANKSVRAVWPELANIADRIRASYPIFADTLESIARTAPKPLADWSALPRDLYVVDVSSDDGIVFDVQCCSVPMAIGPEVRYSISGSDPGQLCITQEWIDEYVKVRDELALLKSGKFADVCSVTSQDGKSL